MKDISRFNYIYLAWIVNLVALCGSLFFSNVLMYPPCSLCWAQRICIYPLSLIFAVGFFKKDQNVFLYALPFVLIGMVISTYHNLLYYDVITEAITACTGGVSCSEKQVEYLGFVTIPLMALISLIFSLVMLIIFNTRPRNS